MGEKRGSARFQESKKGQLKPHESARLKKKRLSKGRRKVGATTTGGTGGNRSSDTSTKKYQRKPAILNWMLNEDQKLNGQKREVG